MKFALLSLGLLMSPLAHAQEEPVQSEQTAESLAESLRSRHAEVGKDPAKALKIWLEAAILATSEVPHEREAGEAILGELTIPLRKDADWRGRPSNRTFTERLEDKAYIFRSYAKGATPDNGYAAPEGWELHVTRTDDGDDRGRRVFIQSGGADSPRPVYLKQSTKTDLYYVNVFANVYVDIRKPVDPDEETFE